MIDPVFMAFIGESVLALFGLLVAGLSLLATVFWIWMIIDCATKESSSGNDKVIWILIILLTHLLGAALYFFARRPQRIAEQGR